VGRVGGEQVHLAGDPQANLRKIVRERSLIDLQQRHGGRVESDASALVSLSVLLPCLGPALSDLAADRQDAGFEVDV
jgi:hypothetical protein